MDYRIGITGAQGSGKTTLARYIDAHYGIPYVDAGVGKLMSSLGGKVLLSTARQPMSWLIRLTVSMLLASMHLCAES